MNSRRNSINHIDILKIDVQGAELLVLKGAQGMLEKPAVSIVYTEVYFARYTKDRPTFAR